MTFWSAGLQGFCLYWAWLLLRKDDPAQPQDIQSVISTQEASLGAEPSLCCGKVVVAQATLVDIGGIVPVPLPGIVPALVDLVWFREDRLGTRVPSRGAESMLEAQWGCW